MLRGFIFSLLAVAGTAIQVAPGYADAGAMCGAERVPFEAVNQYADTCTVYCVPDGECLGQAQLGGLQSYGVTGEGNCKRRGYTESAQMNAMSNATAKYLKMMAGPCRGMTIIPFRKPAGPEAAAATNDGRCKQDQKPYEAISPNFPGVCSVYCVPEGECELQAQTGQLSHFGITGEGNCKHKGYTRAASLGKMGQATAEWLKYQQGACRGMTFAKFEKPEAAPQAGDAGATATQKSIAEPVATSLCGAGFYEWEGVNEMTGTCNAYCVPEGDCLGSAQTGRLKGYGVMRQGNCRGGGYTKPAPIDAMTNATANYLKKAAGPCRGMTITPFSRPPGAPTATLAAAGGGSGTNPGHCMPRQRPYEATHKHFPGVCHLYCVPEGDCETQAQRGRLSHLGITGEGNCRSKGYTQLASLGKMGETQARWLKYKQGACMGMTVAKLEKPAAPPVAQGQAPPVAQGQAPDAVATQKSVPSRRSVQPPRMCASEMTAYEAHNPMYPNVCSVFCVPAGECEGKAQSGQLSYLNIVGRGNCKNKGFTESAAMGALSENIRDSLRWMQGACKGMTYSKFQKPKQAVEGVGVVAAAP